MAAPLLGNVFGLGKVIQQDLEALYLQSSSQVELSLVPKMNQEFGLTRAQEISSVRNVLEERGLHPQVLLKAARTLDMKNLSLLNTSGISEVTDYAYLVGGYPICGASLRSVQHLNGDTVIVGEIPVINHGVSPSDLDWPDVSESARKAIGDISALRGHNPASARVTKVERCLSNQQGFLDLAWDLVITLDGYQYGVHASDNKIFFATPRYFDATATVQAYDPNIATGTLKNFSVTVNGDATMTNTYFTTAIGTGAARQSSASNTFTYTGANTTSAEASVFAHVNQHYDYMASQGYTWQGPKPLTVWVYSGKPNNALYTPFDGVSGPYIRVSEGDGAILQNLAYDTDVVSHEFGHHVVYQSITTIAGEALVLHEGLADFLSFSRTGDACLGESICPTGSTICQVANQCLRTADNTLVYNDSVYSSYATQPHRQGQLVSGFLWDLRKNGAIPGDTLTSLVLQAITYLPSSAAIKNLVAGVLYADSLSNSTYQKTITQIASNRGLDPASLGIDMSNLKSSAEGVAPAQEESSRKKNFFGCMASSNTAAIGEAGSQKIQSWLVALFLLAPIGISVLMKSRLATVPLKKRDR
jgi:hypothetical protein